MTWFSKGGVNPPATEPKPDLKPCGQSVPTVFIPVSREDEIVSLLKQILEEVKPRRWYGGPL
jgi:hypothetical protein